MKGPCPVDIAIWNALFSLCLWLDRAPLAKQAMMGAQSFDIAIAGGGLSGSLIALALAASRPEIRIALVDAGTIGGNHVWSFFGTDVAAGDRALVDPLVASRWDDGYDIAFPAYSRTLGTSYRSITSERLAMTISATLPEAAVFTCCPVTALDAGGLTLADGTRIEAGAVIDARGLAREHLSHLRGGWQKFTGQMVETSAPHGLTRPVVMDASVTQYDGYRFVYCLPFSETSVFVEDTYYSDGPALDPNLLKTRIADYAAARGWQIAALSRTETGVLPVVTGGDFAALWRDVPDGVALAGTRAGLFQPLTSYSLPDAVRYASMIADLPDLSGPAIAVAARTHAQAHWKAGRFYRMLAAMLFGAARPDERYRVLERFYRLDEGLVERFYAGKSTPFDMARVLAGKPPVPLSRAIKVLAGIGAPGHLGAREQG